MSNYVTLFFHLTFFSVFLFQFTDITIVFIVGGILSASDRNKLFLLFSPWLICFLKTTGIGQIVNS